MRKDGLGESRERGQPPYIAAVYRLLTEVARRVARHEPKFYGISPAERKMTAKLDLAGADNQPSCSQQAKVAQASVPAAADDQMIMNGYAERRGGFDDVLSDRDVRLRGGRVARRMIVH